MDSNLMKPTTDLNGLAKPPMGLWDNNKINNFPGSGFITQGGSNPAEGHVPNDTYKAPGSFFDLPVGGSYDNPR